MSRRFERAPHPPAEPHRLPSELDDLGVLRAPVLGAEAPAPEPDAQQHLPRSRRRPHERPYIREVPGDAVAPHRSRALAECVREVRVVQRDSRRVEREQFVRPRVRDERREVLQRRSVSIRARRIRLHSPLLQCRIRCA